MNVRKGFIEEAFSEVMQIKREGGGATPPPSGTGAMASITIATSVPNPKDLGRGRGCCWTLFNFEQYLEKLRKTSASDEVKYCVWGFEKCPKTGREHLQGYINWKNPHSLSKFSKEFGNCHIEVANGTAVQNRAYCLKLPPHPGPPNSRFEEYGELPKQGARTDWEKAITDLKEKDVIDVIIEQPQLAPSQRALREIKSMYLKPLERDVQVIVLYGKGGTGKTRWAFNNYPGLYKKPTGDWWDGYSGQKTVLFDDFYGYFKYHDLLTILDRYPHNLAVKGGYVWAQYDTVIITSNKHPRDWYKLQWGWPLRRRLNRIIKVLSIDGETIYEEEEFPADEEAWASQETDSA